MLSVQEHKLIYSKRRRRYEQVMYYLTPFVGDGQIWVTKSLATPCPISLKRMIIQTIEQKKFKVIFT